MGGNVFPGKTRRYSRVEYEALVKELEPRFELLFKKFSPTPYMKDKMDFGDMDVICVPQSALSNDLIQVVLDTDLISKNGPTWSVAYKEFQIDLITSNEEEFDICLAYHGVADKGNFVGKLAHQIGLKFGHDGLWLPIRMSDDHVVGDILLTCDSEHIHKFLDVNSRREYDTVEQMFDDIVSSKYFNPETFALENNNNIARVRDRKRPTYRKFLEYIETLPKQNYFVRRKDKSVFWDMIFEEFPHAKLEFESLMERKRILDLAATKFNGNLVREWTGYDNKELGELMKKLKQTLTPEKIVMLTNEEIFNFTMENK